MKRALRRSEALLQRQLAGRAAKFRGLLLVQYLIQMGAWEWPPTFLSQPTLLSLLSYRGPHPWSLRPPVSAKLLRHLLAAAVGPQLGECLQENLALPMAPETGESSTGTGVQLLHRRGNDVDGGKKDPEQGERGRGARRQKRGRGR